MIKKYLEFVNESHDKKREDFNSLGEWVEYLYSTLKDDDLDYIKNIVNRNFNVSRKDDLSDIPSDIRLANAINILNDDIKIEIESLIKHFLDKGIEEKDPTIEYSTDVEELTENVTSGKNIFTSFLKCITALGGKNIESDFINCPSNYTFYYEYKTISNDVKMIFSRFSSLKKYVDLIPYDLNEISIYYAINIDGDLEYGFKTDKLVPFGFFKLNSSAIKWLLVLDLKSAFNLKRDLVNYTTGDLKLVGKIKNELNSYNPGFFEKKSEIIIKDKVISIGFYGIGKWDNGKLDIGEYNNLKQNFNNWIISKSWSGKVQYGLKSNSFWVYLSIKIK
jgi:hypothetical protein